MIHKLRSLYGLYSGFAYRQFINSIHPDSLERHDEIYEWALQCSINAVQLEDQKYYEESDDPLVRQGYALVQEVRQKFSHKYGHINNLRILIHVPSSEASPGGFSLFSNLIQALDFIGIPVKALGWDMPVEEYLDNFKPTIFITSDSGPYLEKINWRAIALYQNNYKLKVGLTASIEEYGNTPLKERLGWAQKHGVDFYYSFRAPEYLHERAEYRPFFEAGYQIHSIEFGANPLRYYPVPNISRDIDFAFLASINPDKRARYISFLKPVLSGHAGFIDGPGWAFSGNFIFNQNRDRYIYARAKVGINLHIDNQIEWASELNERTYMLAACGTPQLIDNPGLLPSRFSQDCFFIATNPGEYKNLFKTIISNSQEAQRRTLKAQKEVFSKHTTFHRADIFVKELLQTLQQKI